MSAGGFYISAVLVVLSCAAAVWARRPRLMAIAALAVVISVGLFLLLSGEYLLTLLVVVLLLATLAAIVEAARRGAFGALGEPLPLSRWGVGLGLAVLSLVVLDGAAIAAGNRWHQHGVLAGLAGVLRSQAPLTAALLAVAGVSGVAAAIVIGRVSPDEAEQQRRRTERREREERMRRRREDRAAARRREHAPAGSGENL
ncbi:MAG TPA: hypothetical protein VEK76_11980 [Candidatus Binatia bacterium]|nr:hypothetical protein [Candidatus Binatia bacterium]